MCSDAPPVVHQRGGKHHFGCRYLRPASSSAGSPQPPLGAKALSCRDLQPRVLVCCRQLCYRGNHQGRLLYPSTCAISVIRIKFLKQGGDFSYENVEASVWSITELVSPFPPPTMPTTFSLLHPKGQLTKPCLPRQVLRSHLRITPHIATVRIEIRPETRQQTTELIGRLPANIRLPRNGHREREQAYPYPRRLEREQRRDPRKQQPRRALSSPPRF